MLNTKENKQTIKDLNTSTIEGFMSQLRGDIVKASDPEYNDARKVYNGMINKHPGMIVYCVDVADVIACVNFGRENNLLVAVRGGGHNGGGLGICEEGLVIDMRGRFGY